MTDQAQGETIVVPLMGPGCCQEPPLSIPLYQLSSGLAWKWCGYHPCRDITYCYISKKVLPWWLSDKESNCIAGNTGLSLGLEDPLKEEMATHSNTLVWEIP